MQLPGGVWKNQALDRSFSFKEVTGEMEMRLAELSQSREASIPVSVTNVLFLAVKHVAGFTPTWELVHRLSVVDRQFLMRRLSAHIGLDEHWKSIHCGYCQSAFDFRVDPQNLPIKPAGKGYPFTRVETSIGTLRVRVPSGEDQEAVSSIQSETLAIRKLITRLVLENTSGPFRPEEIKESDLNAIEFAVEEVSPELVVWIKAVCPVCNKENRVSLDPYNFLNSKGSNLLMEIHKIASTYHWSEAEILKMPKGRRLRYLDLIDLQRGLKH